MSLMKPVSVPPRRVSVKTKRIELMNDELISTMTERIVRDFQPVQIILFGSHALWGCPPAKRCRSACSLPPNSLINGKLPLTSDAPLLTYPWLKNILVTTPEELARQRDQVGTILRAAHREGEILYERN